MQIGKRKAEGRKGRGVEGRDKAVIALDMAAGPGRPRLINNSQDAQGPPVCLPEAVIRTDTKITVRSGALFGTATHPVRPRGRIGWALGLTTHDTADRFISYSPEARYSST